MEIFQFFTLLWSILASVVWLSYRIDRLSNSINVRLTEVEKDVSIIKEMLSVGSKERSN
jgi:flagellar biogenesis protein FliO